MTSSKQRNKQEAIGKCYGLVPETCPKIDEAYQEMVDVIITAVEELVATGDRLGDVNEVIREQAYRCASVTKQQTMKLRKALLKMCLAYVDTVTPP